MLAIFMDIEATGLDCSQHRAIDLALQVVDISSAKRLQGYQTLIKVSEEQWLKSDPESLAINGYTWEEVQKGKEPRVVGQEIITLLSSYNIKRGKSAFVCQNPAFDRGFFAQIIDIYTQEKLAWPYHWLDFASMYWAGIAWQSLEQNNPFPAELNLSKNAIAEKLQLPSEAAPHRALTGVEHLISCYQALIGVEFH